MILISKTMAKMSVILKSIQSRAAKHSAATGVGIFITIHHNQIKAPTMSFWSIAQAMLY